MKKIPTAEEILNARVYITQDDIEEEDNEHKPEQLEHWYEVRDEYIKIKTDESLGRTKE